MIYILIIAAVIIVAFLLSLSKDKTDLQGKKASEKFKVLVNDFNLKIYNGEGKIGDISNRAFNLYKESSNEILQFHYSTGSLSVKWSFKYFQKELVKEFTLDKARNLSSFEQLNFSIEIYNKMVREKLTFQEMISSKINSERVNSSSTDEYLKSFQPPSNNQKKKSISNREKIEILSKRLSDLILQSINNKSEENQFTGTSLEGMFYITIMNSEKEEFRHQLDLDKPENLLSDDDIDEICSKGYQSVYNLLFENDEISTSPLIKNLNKVKKYSNTNSSKEDERKVNLLFYKFCFEPDIVKMFLGDLGDSEKLHKLMIDAESIDDAATLRIFRHYSLHFDTEIKEIDYPVFTYNEYQFKLNVERMLFGNKNHYLEILSNNFNNVIDENGLQLAVANNFIVYGEKGKPKYIYVVVKDPLLGQFALRKVSQNGSSHKVTFMPNNESNTVAEAIVADVQSFESADNLPF